MAPPPAAVPQPVPPPLMVASMSPAGPVPLARVQTAVSAPLAAARASGQSEQKAPDLDALADYVLERLRNELRDGRERLGLLLDDSH